MIRAAVFLYHLLFSLNKHQTVFSTTNRCKCGISFEEQYVNGCVYTSISPPALASVELNLSLSRRGKCFIKYWCQGWGPGPYSDQVSQILFSVTVVKIWSNSVHWNQWKYYRIAQRWLGAEFNPLELLIRVRTICMSMHGSQDWALSDNSGWEGSHWEQRRESK